MSKVRRIIERRRWTWRDWLSVLFLAGFVGVALGFLYHQRGHLEVLGSFGIGPLVGVVTLSAISLALLGIAQWLLFRQLAPTLRVAESIQVTISLNFLNYLPAKAGLLGRGAYLHRIHAVAINDYVALTVRSKLIALAATSSVAASIGFASTLLSNDERSWLASALALVTALSFAVYRYGPDAIAFVEKLPMITSVSRHLRRQQFALGTALIVRFAGVVVAAMLCRAGRLYIIFATLGTPLDPAAVVVMEAANVVIALLALLPGNLGLREGSLAALAVGFGVPWQTVVPAVLVDRLATMLVPFVLGPWIIHRLSRRMVLPVREAVR